MAWRWLALRFPEAYINREEAEATTARLNDWIEDVLRQQSIRARTPRTTPFSPDNRANPPGRRNREAPPKGSARTASGGKGEAGRQTFMDAAFFQRRCSSAS